VAEAKDIRTYFDLIEFDEGRLNEDKVTSKKLLSAFLFASSTSL